jgi:hypothetical protein
MGLGGLTKGDQTNSRYPMHVDLKQFLTGVNSKGVLSHFAHIVGTLYVATVVSTAKGLPDRVPDFGVQRSD